MKGLIDKSDSELIKEYHSGNDVVKKKIISIFVARYEPLLLLVLKQFCNMYSYRYSISRSDYWDVRQSGYLGLIMALNNIRDPEKPTNFGVKMKSWIYYLLRKTFRHRLHEKTVPNYSLADVTTDNMKIKDGLPITDEIHYYIYVLDYDYYKIALMYFGSRSKKSMKVKVQKLKKRAMDKVIKSLKGKGGWINEKRNKD